MNSYKYEYTDRDSTHAQIQEYESSWKDIAAPLALTHIESITTKLISYDRVRNLRSEWHSYEREHRTEYSEGSFLQEAKVCIDISSF